MDVEDDGLTVLRDGFIDDDEDALADIIPIFHLSLYDFYPSLSVQLLKRSIDGIIKCPRPPARELQKISLENIIQIGNEFVGDWRHYIIIGCRKTWPYGILTIYRGSDSAHLPSLPTGSVAYWKLDASNLAVSPASRPAIQPSHDLSNCSVMAVNAAWDVSGDCLVQTVTLHGQAPSSDVRTLVRMGYGSLQVQFEEDGSEEPVSCLCGTACMDPQERSIRVGTFHGIYCYFPFAVPDRQARLPFYCTRKTSISPNLYYIDVDKCSRKAVTSFFTDVDGDVEIPGDIQGDIIFHSPPVPTSTTPERHSQYHGLLRYSHVFPDSLKVDLFIITYSLDLRNPNRLSLKITSTRKAKLNDVYDPAKFRRQSQSHVCGECMLSEYIQTFVPYNYEKVSVATMDLEELGVILSGEE